MLGTISTLLGGDDRIEVLGPNAGRTPPCGSGLGMDVVDVVEFGEMLSVSRHIRDQVTKFEEFPSPIGPISASRICERREGVEAWAPGSGRL
jgi:hypothetical protein